MSPNLVRVWYTNNLRVRKIDIIVGNGFQAVSEKAPGMVGTIISPSAHTIRIRLKIWIAV